MTPALGMPVGSPPGGGHDPLVGRTIAHYRVLAVVGQGGMSVVYRARDERLDRDVALKVMHPFLARNPESRERLAREARAVARLTHPYILTVLGYRGAAAGGGDAPADPGPDDATAGVDFLVTEFVEGATLRQVAADARFCSLPEAGCLIAWGIASALAHAHARGVVHRDIKPENVMVRRDGVLKLMDFGIARMLDQQHLTITGTLIGSPAHMAPECIDGQPADARSDVFSLGTLLYWLCTGQLPFDAPTPHALLRAIAEARFPPPQQHSPRISDDVAAILARAMARNPADRFASAEDLADALATVLRDAGIDPSPLALESMLSAPATSLPELSQKVRAAHLARAEALIHARAPARAVAVLARVLAEHPDDEEAKRFVELAQAPAGGEGEFEEQREPGESTSQRPWHGKERWVLGLLFCSLLSAAVAVTRVADERRALPTGAEPVVESAGDFAAKPAAEPPMAPSVAPAPGPGARHAPDAATGSAAPGPDPSAERAASAPSSLRAPEGHSGRPQPGSIPPLPARGPRRASLSPLTTGTRSRAEIHSPPVLPDAAAHSLAIHVWPFADIFVDGERIAVAQARAEVALRAGSHVLRFEHPFAKTREEVVEVSPGDPPRQMHIRLDEAKPAYLRVRAEPPDAEVAVDGVPRGRAGDSVVSPIVLPFPELRARATFELVVWRAGYRPLTERHEFEAGGSADLQVVLQPLPDAPRIPAPTGSRPGPAAAPHTP